MRRGLGLATLFTGAVSTTAWWLVDRGYNVQRNRIKGISVDERKFWFPAREAVVVPAIIAVNLGIFGAWRLAPTSLMQRLFVNAPHARAFTLLTSSFSHVHLMHLGFNMFALWSLKSVEESVGSAMFASAYVGSAVATSYGSLLYQAATKSFAGSVGASGAILTCFAFVAWLRPDMRFGIPFIPADVFSFSGGTFVLVLALVSGVGMVSRGRILPRLDHAGHASALAIGWGLPEGLRQMKIRNGF